MTQKKEKKSIRIVPVSDGKKTEAASASSEVSKNTVKKTVGIMLLFLVTLGIWGVVFKLGYEKYTVSEITSKKENNPVVAFIDNDPVYLSDIQSFAASIPQLSELPFDLIYPRLLEGYLDLKVLLKGAEKMNLEQEEQVKAALRLTRDQILSQTYLSRRLESVVTPEKLRALYEDEISRFVPEEEVRARHILVKTRKEAQDIIVQLNAGADFASLADKKSLDSNGRGGDLGYFTKGMMIPEFSEAAFNLKKGQISKPVKTPFGWHVILVEDIRQMTPPAFDDIQEQLQQAFIEQNTQAVLAEERENMNVTILLPSITEKNDVQNFSEEQNLTSQGDEANSDAVIDENAVPLSDALPAEESDMSEKE